ncbi:MAG: hypothetical protein JNJ46_16760 [Myxococcales bacterium]|nr:hypothetical protein [Myxococcales bacterium]
MTTPCTVILSDIHLAATRAVFKQERALTAFLGRLAQAGPCELVFAGDTFDFLLTPGYTGFSASKAAEHMAAILAAQDKVVQGAQESVVAGLRRFASEPSHEITLLSGNHDPEVLLPTVREVFERTIGRVGSVRYDETLLPGPGERWPVYGRALPGSIWVVHGDRWDPSNAIDREAILKGRDIVLPAGSDLVYQILAPLQHIYPWIFEIKPELHAVLPLLLYLDYQRTTDFLVSHFNLTGRLLRNQVESKLHASVELFGADQRPAVHEPADVSEVLAGALSKVLSQEPSASQQVLLAGLEDWFQWGSPAADTLASHSGVGRWLLRTWIELLGQNRGIQSLARDGSDPILVAASRCALGHANVVIAGHTHGPRALKKDNLCYINTGTWVPVGDIPNGPVDQVIDRLEQGAVWPSHTPRTFARVEGSDFWLGSCEPDGTQRKIS